MTEEWRDIKGYQWYQVSNQGRVRSIDREFIRSNGKVCYYKGQILKPLTDRYGYQRVDLSRQINGRIEVRRLYIHRLVAEAFIKNPQGLPEINHKDENKENNAVLNLEWCDRGYNCRYGLWAEKHAEKSRRPIYCLVSGEKVKEYKSVNEAAADIGVNAGSLVRVLKGKRKRCRGYEWKYL